MKNQQLMAPLIITTPISRNSSINVADISKRYFWGNNPPPPTNKGGGEKREKLFSSKKRLNK